MWASRLVIACCALLSATAIAAEREWKMQDYQLAFITRSGEFCRGVADGGGGSIFVCDTKEASDTFSFNILTTKGSFANRISAGQALQITERGGTGTSLNVNPATGLVASSLRLRGTTMRLSPRAGVTGLPLHFGDTGSNLLYLCGDVAGANGTVTTKYCRTGNYTLGSTQLSSVLFCDLSSTDGAVQLNIRPLGWAWSDKRNYFTNVFTNEDCGNIWHQNHSTYITCDGGARATASQDWRSDMSSYMLRSMTLPMRSNTDFMVQSWIEYGVATYVWQTNEEGDLVSDAFNGGMAPPGNIPYLAMVKNDGPSRNTTIWAGDVVLLRSSLTGGYCRVYGRLHQVHCTYSLHDVQAAPDRSIFQFIYQELDLNDYN